MRAPAVLLSIAAVLSPVPRADDAPASAPLPAEEPWVEVRTANFTVRSNAGTPAARRVGQSVVIAARLQVAHARRNGRGCERRYPQTLDRLAAARRLDDETKDELALAPSVGRADDLFDIRPVEQALDDGKLIGRVVDDHERPTLWKHRQLLTPPRLPLTRDLVRSGQAHQVTDSPGDRESVTE